MVPRFPRLLGRPVMPGGRSDAGEFSYIGQSCRQNISPNDCKTGGNMYKKVDVSLDFVSREKEIIELWKQNDVFEKSVKKN